MLGCGTTKCSVEATLQVLSAVSSLVEAACRRFLGLMAAAMTAVESSRLKCYPQPNTV